MSGIVLSPIKVEQTVSSRFFNNPETLQVAAFNFSQDFWIEHSDLLSDGHGVVLSSGLDKFGQPIKLDGDTKQLSLTLMFDARRRHEGIYTWQYGLANQFTGRVIEQMMVGAQQLRVQRFVFNSQGALESTEIDNVDQLSLMRKVEDCTTHPKLTEQVAELRTRRNRAEADLSRFSVEGITKFARPLYNQLLTQKQKQADNLGFVALQPFVLSKG